MRSLLVAVVPACLLILYFAIHGEMTPGPAGVLALVILAGGIYAVRRRVHAERAVLDRLNRLSEETQTQADTLRYKAAAADRIVSSLPDPIFFLDRRRRVVRMNRGAERLLDQDLTGRDLGEGLRHPDLLAAIDRALADGAAQQVEVALPGPVAATYIARIERVETPPGGSRAARGEEPPALLVDLQDVTALIRSEQMRVDFVANVSHELRTPLTSLTGFIETLRGPAKDDAEARERFLAIMQEQAERMFRLINDLLSLSRIELDEHSRPTETVEIAGVVETVSNMLALKAERKGMTIDVSLPEEGGSAVRGDEDQLVQVFLNLIDNAIKYGAKGTAVKVVARRRDQRRLAVDVIDTGAGIPADHIPRLTERFYRVDAARSRELGGTGLGLAIVKHIVNRHRGRLTITSREGEGSCFTVTLPTPAGGRAADTPASGPQTGGRQTGRAAE
ncbi:PAS domain-containing protein [Marivibrio halodurans]|uniref:histidine kinase n=1 Tax=Marivibrio halodurans TaxID=2039722 RepID=A0A8J7S159_9PROT|nr:ATP-binding protein [Marivibrio halodurans]MBP5857995.1 PAS domain-containing protein [Marivibrio halodurans]